MKIFAILIALLLAGCVGNIPPNDVPTPKPLSTSSIGAGHEIALVVIDKRADTQTSPIDKVFVAAATNALRAHAFTISSAAAKRIDVEITTVDFHFTAGLVTGTVYAAVSIRCIARSPERMMSRDYRSNAKHGWQMAPPHSGHQQILSDQIGKVIDDAVTDLDVLDVLTRPAVPTGE